ncbi:MAG: SPOR domain-containing protein [Winogradskyella sp.]|nr:SPOR domain-containing protein [Winogradskyella sp.]NNL82012.1 SPOR domain-containing protein [Winogradskyella sp.]
MKYNIFKIISLALLVCFTVNLNAQEGTVTVVQDKDIDKLLEFKKDTRTQDVYKIQIFQGERSRAEQEMKEFQSIYGQWPVSMRFNTPNYKIWVGNFTNRLEADRALVRIKRNYMNAFIFQPKDD